MIVRLAMVALIATGCSSPAPGPAESPGPPICDDGINSPVVEIERRIGVVGPTSNAIRRFGDEAYVVESGSNTVARLTLSDEAYDVHVDVGNERNPWNVWASEEELWITNYLADTVTVADRRTGEVLEEIAHPSFAAPSGIGGTARYVYVGNAHYRGTNDYGDGTVSIIDRTSREVVAVVSTAAKNPLHLESMRFSFGERLVVVASGAHHFGDDGSALVGSPGAIELWEETEDGDTPERTVFELGDVAPEGDPRLGLPGRPMQVGDTLYFASATAPALFKLDAASGELLRGLDDPIMFSDEPGDSLNHAAVDQRGAIVVTSFNENALYVVDTACDEVLAGPVELVAGQMLAGVHDLITVSDDEVTQVYILFTHANEISRVDFTFEER